MDDFADRAPGDRHGDAAERDRAAVRRDDARDLRDDVAVERDRESARRAVTLRAINSYTELQKRCDRT